MTVTRSVPGISGVAVGTRQRQSDAGRGVVLERLGGPHGAVEPVRSAVQMIRSVVRREMIRRAVEREPRVGDAIRVSAHDRAEVPRVAHVVGERVVAEHDVVELAVAVGSVRAIE